MDNLEREEARALAGDPDRERGAAGAGPSHTICHAFSVKRAEQAAALRSRGVTDRWCPIFIFLCATSVFSVSLW
jgi:hypothetical protein